MKYLVAVIFFTSVICINGTHSGTISKDAEITTTTITTTTTVVTTTTKPSPRPLSAGIKWDTKTTDSTAYWPTTASPIASLLLSAQATFACIRYHESRNHVNSVSYGEAGGLYQFLNYIWAHYGGLKYAQEAQYASGIEQDAVAVNVYKANGGFLPEWSADTDCF